MESSLHPGQGSWTHTVQPTLLTGAQTASCLTIAVSQLPRQAPELQGTRPPPCHLSRGAQPSSKARAQALHHDSLAPRQLTPKSRAPPSPASQPWPLTTTALPTLSTVVLFTYSGPKASSVLYATNAFFHPVPSLLQDLGTLPSLFTQSVLLRRLRSGAKWEGTVLPPRTPPSGGDAGQS